MKKRAPRIVARGKPLHISVSVQVSFVNNIMPHVDDMLKETRKEIEKLFAADFAAHLRPSVGMDASISSQTRIMVNALKKRYDQLFGKIAGETANSIADAINRNSFDSSRMSAIGLPHLKDAAKQLTIDMRQLDKSTLEILRNSSNRAADFIRTIPEHYLNKVGEAVYDSIAKGNGLQDLQPFLEKYDTGTKNWVYNTAMDQTRKAYNGLNMGRMKAIGIRTGEWIHSGGSQHPRELHVDFNGQTFDLDKGAPVGDDDGNDVMPGEEPYCRCTFAPVITDEPPEADEEENEGAAGETG